MPPVITPELCIGCGTCSLICNSDIFIFIKGKMNTPEVAYPDECWHCNSCVLDCPSGAIKLRIPLTYYTLHRDGLAGDIHHAHDS